MKSIKWLILLLAVFITGVSGRAHAQIGPNPCGASSSLTTWVASVPYSIGQTVIYNGIAYQSLINNNVLWNPCSSPSQWTSIIGGSGGGGGLPTATAPGQMYSSTAAGTTAAVQGQIFYAQSGDTLTTITSECSSLCTYVVTNPQTITLSASAALSANIQLDFRAGGKWTVNGSGFKLSIPGNVSGTPNPHFAGTGSVAFGAMNPLIPVEWFGAVGNGSTDDTAAIQATLNSITYGQALLQAKTYVVATGPLSITTSNVGIIGTKHGYGGSQSILLNTTASTDTVDVVGSSGSYTNWGKFTDFTINRSVIPTGTAAGFSASFAGGIIVDRLISNDSVRGFYLHAVPGYGVGYVSNSEAQWGFNGVTETSGNLYGFYLDSADGVAENSIYLTNDGVSSDVGSTPVAYGMIVTGTAINDVYVSVFNTAAVSYGVYVDYTGGGTNFAASDLHFIGGINDQFYKNAYYITGLAASSTASLEIDGGFSSTQNSTAWGVDIESSSGVTISNIQVGSHAGSVTLNGIFIDNSHDIVVTGNNVLNDGVGIYLQTSTSCVVSGNAVYSSAFEGSGAIYLTSTSTNNTVVGNTINNHGLGITFDSTSANNVGAYSNAFDSTVTTPIADANGTNDSITVSSIGSGVSGNTDLRGHLTLSGGTATYTFAGTYTVAPTCVATDTTTAAAVKASASTTVLTLTGTGTDVLNYVCAD